MNKTNTMAGVIHAMRSRGYITTFTIQNDSVYCPELNTTIAPANLTLLERHEVEALDKESKREIYGFRTNENILGIMTNAYADIDQTGFTNLFTQCQQASQK